MTAYFYDYFMLKKNIKHFTIYNIQTLVEDKIIFSQGGKYKNYMFRACIKIIVK